MTNYHVGLDCIQALSSPEHDYVTGGFYAATKEQEAKCPGLELNVLMSIEDVTAQVNAGAGPDMDSAARNTAQKAVMARLEKECLDKTGLRCDVVVLYAGRVFNLYRFKKYTDVRLVFAPEHDIFWFGGDPDNFTYPRYALDISFFRVYENNQPVKAKHFLTWSPRGIQEGDVAFVSGNPGLTSRHDTLSQLEFFRDKYYPFYLNLLNGRLKRLYAFSARGPEEARTAKEEIFGLENSVKAFRGYLDGLRDPNLMAARAATEKELRLRVGADAKLQKESGGAWDAMAKAQQTFGEFYRDYLLLSGATRSKLYLTARHLIRLPVETAKPNEQRLPEYRESNLESVKLQLFSKAPVYESLEKAILAGVFTDFRDILGAGNPLVQKILGTRSSEEAAEAYGKSSKLKSVEERQRLFDGGQKAVDASGDSMIALAKLMDSRSRELRKRYEDEVEAAQRKNGALLTEALFATQGTNTYPDATFTLRLSFGAAKGYVEEGRPRRWYTTFHGLYEHDAGILPYKLPKRWLEKKAALNLDTPFNFVLTADITGGNSGSPVVNRRGELVGIIFDGNIQSLANDYVYSEEAARSVAVHAAGIVEALRKVYAAESVLRELKFSDSE